MAFQSITPFGAFRNKECHAHLKILRRNRHDIQKYLPIAFVIAVIAAALQCVDQLLSQNMLTKYAAFGWISFQAWAVYFLGGCTVKGGVKAFSSATCSASSHPSPSSSSAGHSGLWASGPCPPVSSFSSLWSCSLR